MTQSHFRAGVGFLVLVTIVLGCGKPAGTLETTREQPPVSGDATASGEAIKRLDEIGRAMHKYLAVASQFPTGIVGPNGTPGLSWRVQILPYFGEEEVQLFKQFNTNEPWDSEHNKKLLSKMPKVFESPGKAAPAGKTYLQSFVGETAFIPVPQGFVPKESSRPVFPGLKAGAPIFGRGVQDIPDGFRNTLMVAEAAEPVEWTKPEDLPFFGVLGGVKTPAVPKLGGLFPGGFHGLTCGGTVYFFPSSLREKTLRAMITINGRETLDEEATKLLWPTPPNQEDTRPRPKGR